LALEPQGSGAFLFLEVAFYPSGRLAGRQPGLRRPASDHSGAAHAAAKAV